VIEDVNRGWDWRRARRTGIGGVQVGFRGCVCKRLESRRF
jgi:hypothetical protein